MEKNDTDPIQFKPLVAKSSEQHLRDVRQNDLSLSPNAQEAFEIALLECEKTDQVLSGHLAYYSIEGFATFKDFRRVIDFLEDNQFINGHGVKIHFRDRKS